MLFHTFSSQKEREKFGGSDFLEMQFCKRKPETTLQKLLSISNVKHWMDDSLYVHMNDLESFVKEYRDIFDGSIYCNFETGLVDIHGLNYYRPDSVDPIIVKIFSNKGTDYEILVDWLYKARYYNGFYILGI